MDQDAREPTHPKYESAPKFDEADIDSLLQEDHTSFHNVFAVMKHKAPMDQTKPTTGQKNKVIHQEDVHFREDRLPEQVMPKMDFPDFSGKDPKVWLDNYRYYFELYHIPEGMWVTAARVHLKDNAGRWYQAFKQKNSFKSWTHFCYEVEQEFGRDDCRKVMHELLELKQTSSVEEYTTKF